MTRTELVPDDQHPWLRGATRYRCPACDAAVFSDWPDPRPPKVYCLGLDGHVLEWA